MVACWGVCSAEGVEAHWTTSSTLYKTHQPSPELQSAAAARQQQLLEMARASAYAKRPAVPGAQLQTRGDEKTGSQPDDRPLPADEQDVLPSGEGGGGPNGARELTSYRLTIDELAAAARDALPDQQVRGVN
jgi:hypothetical protein